MKNKKAPKTAEGSSKGKSKSKSSKKRDDPESKPLLETTGDLLGLDLNRSDESDALLLELASLDFGPLTTTGSSEQFLKGQTNDDDPLLGQDSFQANFEQVFGSSGAASDPDWNQYLPSHFLTSNYVSAESPMKPINASLPTMPSTPLLGENQGAKKGTSTAAKNKVFFISCLDICTPFKL